MTIDKAQRRLENYLNLRKPEPLDNFNEAVQLGIEALKILLQYRKSHYDARYALLLGETK